MKNKKGQYGYIHTQKKIEVIKTISLFLISLGIFLMGYQVMGVKENLWTVIAILGMLPASKSMVSMIMFLKNKTGSVQAFEETEANKGELLPIYDLIITTRDKSYPVNVIVCKQNMLYGYTQKPGTDYKPLEQHLTVMLKNGGYGKISVKIIEDLNQFIKRLNNLTANEIALEPSNDRSAEILNAVLSLSL